jgi:hypothetical protein
VVLCLQTKAEAVVTASCLHAPPAATNHRAGLCSAERVDVRGRAFSWLQVPCVIRFDGFIGGKVRGPGHTCGHTRH